MLLLCKPNSWNVPKGAKPYTNALTIEYEVGGLCREIDKGWMCKSFLWLDGVRLNLNAQLDRVSASPMATCLMLDCIKMITKFTIYALGKNMNWTPQYSETLRFQCSLATYVILHTMWDQRGQDQPRPRIKTVLSALGPRLLYARRG